MAPIFLLSNPEINPKILPKLNTESLTFYLSDIEKCIEMVNSLPSDTRLPIYFISDHLESIEDPSMDGLLALLLSLETFLKEFQFNWITPENCDDEKEVLSTVSMWKEAFPFINFTSNFVSSIQLPQIGQIQSKHKMRAYYNQ